MFYKENNNVIK